MSAVSEFYYEIWLKSHYGPEPLEPFVFQIDEIKNNQAEEKKNSIMTKLNRTSTGSSSFCREKRFSPNPRAGNRTRTKAVRRPHYWRP